MKKRLLALLLCLVMVIGLVPFALAAEAEEYDKMLARFIRRLRDKAILQKLLIWIAFRRRQRKDIPSRVGPVLTAIAQRASNLMVTLISIRFNPI